MFQKLLFCVYVIEINTVNSMDFYSSEERKKLFLPIAWHCLREMIKYKDKLSLKEGDIQWKTPTYFII